MKTQIILRGKTIDPIVEVDGKIIPYTLNENRNRVYDILTDNEISRIKIYTLEYELSEKHWWKFALLFYIISIFGIFDTRYPKKCFTLFYEGDLKDSDTLEIRLSNGINNSKAIECLNGIFDDNETNVYGFDYVAKKRRNMVLIFKLISWVIIAVIISLVLINIK